MSGIQSTGYNSYGSGSESTSESISITIQINEGTGSSDGTGSSGGIQNRPNPFLDPNGPFANLDLTSQQQQQIEQIFQQNASSGQPQSWSQLLSQVNGVLTSSQQQTLQSDLQTIRADHHHRGGGSGGSGGVNPLAQLDLTSAQQTQIGQIIQSAQSSNESPNDVLSQIDNVLTPTQQQQLVNLFSNTGSSGTSSSQSGSEPYVISTSA